jgi:steroid 5-alpha reductase family enzyme
LASQPAQAALGLSGGIGGVFSAASLAFLSPAFTVFVLTKLSGIPMSEKKYDKRYGGRQDYQEWKKNTPKFFPRLF